MDNIARRVMYGHLLTLAPAAPGHEKLHSLISGMWNAMYEDPELLAIPEFPDESYPWHMVNNQRPELDAKYKAVFKPIFEFWRSLHTIALNGELDGGTLSLIKAPYKAYFAPLLEKAGFTVVKNKAGVHLTHAEPDILPELCALAQLSVAHAAALRAEWDEDVWFENAWVLFDFMRCSFDGEWEYIVERVDDACNMHGAFTGLLDQCRARGYQIRLRPECMQTVTSGFYIDFIRGVGGFRSTYNPRKTQKFAFGTKNGIGEKKMIEDLEQLSPDMQAHFLAICRPCNDCLGCTKGGRNKPFTMNIGGNRLCPMFPQHEWPELTSELVDTLFAYHELQEKYGK